MDENNEISNQPELQVVGYCDSDGFLNKHCHGDYSEPVCLVAVSEEIIAQRDARIEEQAREIERLKGAREHLRLQASIQAQEARTQKAIVSEIGAMVGEPDDCLTAGAVRAALKAQPSGDCFGEFSKGDTYTSGDDGKFEAGINHRTTDANDMVFDGKIVSTSSEPGNWFQRIVVYGSTAEQAKALRDVVLARLNSSPVSAGDGMCNADNPAARCICREEFGRRVCAGGVDERAAFEALEADCREMFHWVRGCGAYENGIKEIVRRAKARALNAGSAVPDDVRRDIERLVGEAIGECGDSRAAPDHAVNVAYWLANGVSGYATAPTAKKEG